MSIDTNNPQGMQLGRFKNRTPARFEYIYYTLFPLCHSNQDIQPFLKDTSCCPCFCFVHTIAQFSRIVRFSHMYCQFFSFKETRMTEVTCHCINFNDRVRKVPNKLNNKFVLVSVFVVKPQQLIINRQPSQKLFKFGPVFFGRQKGATRQKQKMVIRLYYTHH